MVELGSTFRRGARLALIAIAVCSLLLWPSGPAGAQTVREVFQKVAPSTVVIRARGRDVEAGGETRFTETGSGVLISADGKVMTAAHVVHSMDEISVEFLGGETVSARVVASEPGADPPCPPLPARGTPAKPWRPSEYRDGLLAPRGSRESPLPTMARSSRPATHDKVRPEAPPPPAPRRRVVHVIHELH